jgi:putative membrane protein insertion efficiency factor
MVGKEDGPMNRRADVQRVVLRIPAQLLIATVRLYQWLISPLLGRGCRFEPSCSAYFIESVRKYGAIRGTGRGVWRICRCNPWNPGGHDPP